MKTGVKPLIDRLRNEVAGTDVDPEALIEIFKDWGDALIKHGHYNDDASTWLCFKRTMDLNE